LRAASAKMTEPEQDRLEALSKPFFKRVDIGIFTGLCAVFISALALLTSFAQMKAYNATQKAAVMPIIDIDHGYIKKDKRSYFEVTFNNAGAGIAHIQRITPIIKGEPVAEYKTYADAIMIGRMQSWAVSEFNVGTGFVRAGDSVTPVSYRIGGGESDLPHYLRGKWGTPMDGVDVEVCYCSVFDACWTVSYLDRKQPQPVKSCNIGNVPKDGFQTLLEQRESIEKE